MFLLPWLAFLSIWAVLIRYGMGVRVALLAAHVINGVLIVLGAEMLSAFQSLTMVPLGLFWSLVFLVNLFLYCRLRNEGVSIVRFPSFNANENILLVPTGLIFVITGIIALWAPPNTFDSQVYHMARVAHWAYNGSVANYPTSIIRQLVYPPYGEFAILHVYILSGGDRFANMVQWTSMVASLAGVSLVAELLGGARRAQLFAVLFAATVPMGILQASSTQNDYVATLWAICVAVFAMLLINTGRRRWGILGALGFALATFTKGTVVFFSLPFVMWALWKVQWKTGYKIALALLGLAAVLVVNVAFLHRLSELAPDPYQAMLLGGKEPGEASVLVETLDVRGLISNAVRGMATELSAPWPDWNRLLLRGVAWVHHQLGVDVNDPRFTFGLSRFTLWDYAPLFEDFMTSWAHAIIYLLVAVYLAIGATQRAIGKVAGRVAAASAPAMEGQASCRWPQNKLFFYFVAVFLAAVLIFCGLVKWQDWIARFHLPFFVLFSAVAAVVLDGAFAYPRLSLPVGAVMFICAWLPLLQNPQRPLLSYGAVNRSALEFNVPRGGAIFDWLMQNGFFRETSGSAGYLQHITADMQDRLRRAYPAEYAAVWTILSEETLSFPGGIFFTPREELLFGRFSQMSRELVGYNIQFMRQQLQASPGCRDVGFIKGPIEYPFWSVLNASGRKIRIEHLLVENASRDIPYPRGAPEPCMILQEGAGGPDMIIYHGRRYVRRTSGPIQVYVEPKPPISPLD